MQQWEYAAPCSGTFPPLFSPPSQYRSREPIESSTADVGRPTENIIIKKEIQTPIVKNGISAEKSMNQRNIKAEPYTPCEKVFRRRSLSADSAMHSTKSLDDVNILTNQIENMKVTSTNKIKNFKTNITQNMFLGNMGKKSSSMSSLLTNSIKYHNKHMTTAEYIYHIQKDTPERFHSRSRNQLVLPSQFMKHHQSHCTVPQSPMLISKTRVRPVTALSREQLEELEYEESKKFKIKAHPVSNAVLQGIPNLGRFERRPVTKPEPFKLTEMKKKPVNSFDDLSDKVFTARPMPKRIFEKPPELCKKIIPCTVPKSPNITKTQKHQPKQEINISKAAAQHSQIVKKTLKSLNLPLDIEKHLNHGEVGHSNVPLSHRFTNQPCKPIPFSFDQKIKEMELRRKEKIQKVLEEEKKLREFHAKPVPAIIRKRSKTTGSPQSPGSVHSVDSKHENKENKFEKNHTNFKARPPTVLSKKPYVPNLGNKLCTEPHPIQLTTEERSKKRHEFDSHIKEKEYELEKLRKKYEDRLAQQENEKIQALRALQVHKAAPVRHYRPFVLQPSTIPLTVANSPNFSHAQ